MRVNGYRTKHCGQIAGRRDMKSRKSMDGDNSVRAEIERLDDHAKASRQMSIPDWKEF
jgi:hypothetical protein